jgi:hypothetical protein
MAAEKAHIPYGISEGEYYGKGSTAKWKRGRFRKEAEAAEAKGTLDDNQSTEDNIRERQAHLKNEYAVEQNLKRHPKASGAKSAGRKR